MKSDTLVLLALAAAGLYLITKSSANSAASAALNNPWQATDTSAALATQDENMQFGG